MKIFKTKNFNRFARKETLEDAALFKAAVDAAAGHIDADLGGASSSNAWGGKAVENPAGSEPYCSFAADLMSFSYSVLQRARDPIFRRMN
jgi:hypothetical protein